MAPPRNIRPFMLGLAVFVLLAFTFFILGAFGAKAQTLESGSAAQAIAIAGGGSGSGYNGGTIRQRVINNPDIALGGSISTAPCVVAGGGAGSGGGIGLAIQFGLDDDECKALRRVQMAMTLGGAAEGAELACSNFSDYRAMRLRVGRPCVQDQPVQAAPVAAQPTQDPRAVRTAMHTDERIRPAYCSVPGIANSECR